MLNRWQATMWRSLRKECCHKYVPRSGTTVFDVFDADICVGFLLRRFRCATPAVKHSLPSPMALLCHGIPTSARDFPVYSKLYYHIVFSLEFFFSVKAPLCWVCNRSTVGFGGKHLPVPKRQQFQRHSGVARCRMCCIRCVVCFEQTAHFQKICSCARGGGNFCDSCRHFRRNTKRAPSLYVESSITLPPSSVATERQIAKPKPVP